jgi:putative membrane protein
MNNKTISTNWIPTIIYSIFFVLWLTFYFAATDVKDWWIENILVILFMLVLIFGRKKIHFSNTALVFVFAFLFLHVYGAKMAYTKNEFGAFLQNTYHLQRNPYDRIVHFSFGFLLLFPFVELLKKRLANNENFVFLFANMGILCLATIFELIEWGVAAFTDKITGETYVATQGDPWDAQKDIILAVVGSMIVTTFLKIKKPNLKSLA